MREMTGEQAIPLSGINGVSHIQELIAKHEITARQQPYQQ